MTRFEKIAWFSLTVCLLSITGFCALAPFTGFRVATAMLGIIGFTGLSPFLFKDSQPTDERDLIIQRHAVFGAHLMFWVCFVLGSIGIWGWRFYHKIPTIEIEVLPMQVFWGMLIIVTVQSLLTIIQYRRG